LLKEGPFEKIWIQPAAGDAGGAIGCALAAWHGYFEAERTIPDRLGADRMRGSYLGPEFKTGEIESFLKSRNIPHRVLEEGELLQEVASELAREKVVGWFRGRME